MTERNGEPTESPTRRAVLLGAGAVGAAGLLAACGSNPQAPRGDTQPGPSGLATTEPATQGPIHTSDVPVGGGTIYPLISTVITQPTAGTFKGFDSTCKHLGCTVGSVSNGLIVCPCHGSTYRITDGSVANGPATGPLDPKKLTVNGGVITVS